VIRVVLHYSVASRTERASFFEIVWFMRALRFIKNLAISELACARLIVCWVAFCGQVAYDVRSLEDNHPVEMARL
jgi:hypothetical protein